MQQRVIYNKEQYRSLSGWHMAANNLFTSYRTDNSSINTIIRVLLLHIDEPCSACSECGINLRRTSWTAIIPLFFFPTYAVLLSLHLMLQFLCFYTHDWLVLRLLCIFHIHISVCPHLSCVCCSTYHL